MVSAGLLAGGRLLNFAFRRCQKLAGLSGVSSEVGKFSQARPKYGRSNLYTACKDSFWQVSPARSGSGTRIKLEIYSGYCNSRSDPGRAAIRSPYNPYWS